jgi:ribulose-5-phosphate 4-epimerase/fuculose-1-phosphate aldolase
MGLSDVCGGFDAARIEGEDALIIRGQRQHPGLVKASTLFRRGMNDVPIKQKNYEVNAGALMMSQAIFKARPDVNVIMHGHTPASMVFSALDIELEPVSQFGVMYHGRLPKIPFGDVDTDDWCRDLVGILGDNPALLFGNHGIAVVGRDAKQAMHNLYAIEQAMQIQITLLQTGAPIARLEPDWALHEQKGYWGGDETTDYDGSREWEAWMELAEKLDPSFAD